MTVYVDNAGIPATVPNGRARHTSRWSHLTADSQEELHEFAAALGLKRSYFQPGTPLGNRPSVAWHYDVTSGKRLQALRMGAREIGPRDMHELLARRREEQQARETTGPGRQPVIPAESATRGSAADLDRSAGLAYQAGQLDKALGLIAVARLAFPADGARWDDREAAIRTELAHRDRQASL